MYILQHVHVHTFQFRFHPVETKIELYIRSIQTLSHFCPGISFFTVYGFITNSSTTYSARLTVWIVPVESVVVVWVSRTYRVVIATTLQNNISER